MTSWPHTALLLVVTGLSLACSRAERGAAGGDEQSERAACSVSALRPLLATDTARLRRLTAPVAPEASSEGGEVVIFLSSDSPRVIHATYFGEMGRATEEFFVRDEASFVRVRSVTKYGAPLAEVPNGAPATVTRDTVWVCQGRALPPADSVAASEALTTLQAIIRYRR